MKGGRRKRDHSYEDKNGKFEESVTSQEPSKKKRKRHKKKIWTLRISLITIHLNVRAILMKIIQRQRKKWNNQEPASNDLALKKAPPGSRKR